MDFRTVIKIVLLFVLAALLQYFIRHDHYTIAFCLAVFFLGFGVFLFPKDRDGK